MDRIQVERIARATVEKQTAAVLNAVFGFLVEELSEADLAARLRSCFRVQRDEILKLESEQVVLAETAMPGRDETEGIPI